MRRSFALSCCAVFAVGANGLHLRASDCTRTSTGLVPLNDLGTGLYLGQFQGGLYPNGLNTPPQAHAAEGLARAAAIQPLNTLGQPDPNGKYVLLSIGMSNTTQEFCSQPGTLPCNSWTFMGQAAANANVNHTTLVIANGARGGQVATDWDSPTDPDYEMVRTQVLVPQGLSEAQVQVLWVKEADANPTVHLPNSNADAYLLEQSLGNIARAAKVRYPNLQIIFLSSRIYAGYASSTLNPEPYAYETGFANKWVIQSQITQMAGGQPDARAGNLNYNTGVAPWLAWGPYLWADGETARSDGLVWHCSDVENDGTHPATSGEQKVGNMLLNFMLNSPFARRWFRSTPPFSVGDLNCDGAINNFDIDAFVMAVTHPAQYAATYPNCDRVLADVNGDGAVNNFDVEPFVQLLIR